MDEVPVVVADDLTPAQIKAFRIADNKVAEKASWDFPKLADEIRDIDTDFDFTELGFGEFELDVLLNGNDFEEDDEFLNATTKEKEYKEKLSVVIDCETEQEAQNVFEKLQKEGYSCRISTL